MPPQHGKSELVSRRFPAFLFGLDPTLNIAVASYAQGLASQFNRETQRIMDEPKYRQLFPKTLLSIPGDTYNRGELKRTRSEFEIAEYYGRLISIGIGGGLTGKTVDIGIIDDPIKDAEQAYSALYREKVWDWYMNVFLTRMHNESKVLLTMTRWHEDDLAGRIIAKAKENNEEWEILSLPAIKENNENPYDKREIGEALWPKRHSAEKILGVKALSPTVFTSLYQQAPAPEEGNRIKIQWIKNFSLYELNNRAFDDGKEIVWDFCIDGAYTKDNNNDPTGIISFSRIYNNIYIRQVDTVRMEMPELLKYIPSFCLMNGYSDASRIYIEPKASGLSIAQMLRERTGLNIIIDRAPTTSKEGRVDRCIPFIETGRLYIVEAAAWRDMYLHELRMFPYGAHDDLVDCTVMAINKIELLSEMKIYGFAAI